MKIFWKLVARFGKDDHHRISTKAITDIDGIIYAGVQPLLADRMPCGADLGCGTGAVAAKLAKHFDSFIATDIASAIKKENLSSVSFHIMDLHSPDIPHESHDLIFINSVLQIFTQSDAKSIIEKVFALLKPGGTLILGEVPFERHYFERSICWRILFQPYMLVRWVYARFFVSYTHYDNEFFTQVTGPLGGSFTTRKLDERHPYVEGCLNVVIKKQ